MTIRIATLADLPVLSSYDHHITENELENLIRLGRVTLAEAEGQFVGWFRWNLFWDNTPFLNMLYLLEPHRGKGYGQELMAHWENQMRGMGFDRVMTSTASDEYAQHFYQKLGYIAIGGFTPSGDAYEIIFEKLL
jgi:GNAT superfamily N-acetyltransferase